MTLIELSAAWCFPCNDMASWLTTNDLKIRENPWWKDRYLPVRDLIENGEVQLINIMFEGKEKKTTATFEDIVSWHKNYPDPHVPILVDENMRLINYTSRSLTDAFLYLTQSKK